MAKTKFEVAAFIKYFREKGFECTHHDRDTSEGLRQSWRAMVASNQYQAYLRKKVRGFDWEIFSSGRSAYLQGNDAISLLNRRARGNYYIWPQLERVGSLEVRDQPVPGIEVLERARSAHWCLADLYLSSARFDWTFVITHEGDWEIGPFYAEAGWQRTFKPGPLTLAAVHPS